MSSSSNLRKNPSRETCEGMIKRILVTEVLEKGCNEQFRQASDFMNYFESLYPASDALTKQVQRAVKAMELPKDDRGYFIINKTMEQISQEKEFREVLQKGKATCYSLEDCSPYLLHIDPAFVTYLMHLISNSVSFQNKYVTMHAVEQGILFYTKNVSQLEILLTSLMPSDM